MSMIEAVRAGFRHYADFSGRARRPEFWWWILFTTLVSSALGAIPVWTLEMPGGTLHLSPGFSGLWSIAVLLPTLGVTVRRLRDAGYGWGNVFWVLLPLAGLIVLAVFCAQPSRQPTVTTPPVPPQQPYGPAPYSGPAAPAGRGRT